jgi:hypothetical protein
MKNLFATAIGTSLLTAGILSMSALGASAAWIGTYPGNNSNDPVTYEGVTYDFFGKYDVDEEQFEGQKFTIDFTLLDDGEYKAGTASVGTGSGLFAVKAGNQYALYFAEDLSNISWDTSELGNKGLSHLSVYKAEVPEPLTLMGSAVALGFGGYFQRKRNAKKSA